MYSIINIVTRLMIEMTIVSVSKSVIHITLFPNWIEGFYALFIVKGQTAYRVR
ncbi:MAG: hypothetical protein R3Y33_08215 [Clostridia bacterium]